MATLIKASGDVIDVHPRNENQVFELDELQSYVGGWIECVYLNKHQVMVINEEGKLNGLPYNSIATAAYQMALQPSTDFIVGDVLLCNYPNEID